MSEQKLGRWYFKAGSTKFLLYEGMRIFLELRRQTSFTFLRLIHKSAFALKHLVISVIEV